MTDQHATTPATPSTPSNGVARNGVIPADTSREMQYWKENHSSKSYASPTAPFEDFAAAYRLGWLSCVRRSMPDQTFESVEADLAREWTKVRGKSPLVWLQVKEATRAAWNRIKQAERAPDAPAAAGP